MGFHIFSYFHVKYSHSWTLTSELFKIILSAHLSSDQSIFLPVLHVDTWLLYTWISKAQLKSFWDSIGQSQWVHFVWMSQPKCDIQRGGKGYFFKEEQYRNLLQTLCVYSFCCKGHSGFYGISLKSFEVPLSYNGAVLLHSKQVALSFVKHTLGWGDLG